MLSGWPALLAALLLAFPAAATETPQLPLVKVTRQHWIYTLVENARQASSDQERKEILGVLMYRAQELGTRAEELQAIRQRLLEQVRIEGDSQLMRDVITTLTILIHTRRGESGLPPVDGPWKYTPPYGPIGAPRA